MVRVLDVEPGGEIEETELGTLLGLSKGFAFTKVEAVLNVTDSGLLLVCDFICVEDEKSELWILSDIREVDEAEDPCEGVTPTEFEFDVSDAAVGVSGVMAPLPELHLEDADSDEEVNNDLVKLDGGSDEDGEMT